MILKRGITGFTSGSRPGSRVSSIEFKACVHAVATELDLHVSQFRKAGITPNFHSAQLDSPTISIWFLMHSVHPVCAFAKPQPLDTWALEFLECPQVEQMLSRFYPSVEVLKPVALNESATPDELAQLDPVEHEQIKYWKPETVGEIIFNGWD